MHTLSKKMLGGVSSQKLTAKANSIAKLCPSTRQWLHIDAYGDQLQDKHGSENVMLVSAAAAFPARGGRGGWRGSDRDPYIALFAL